MGLARKFKAETSVENTISLNWQQPLDFNETVDELIITRTINHFPVELFNEDFPDRATDSIPIEIFRGKTIVGLDTNTISVSGNVLTDTAATFPTNPSLTGRLFRDINSQVFKVVSNTSTAVTLDGTPANGKYIILAEFPEDESIQENYELDDRTEAGPGFIRNLVVIQEGTPVIKLFIPGELCNLIFMDGAGDKFIIKNNTEDTVFFFETDTPVVDTGMLLIQSHYNSSPKPYLDNFLTEAQADSRSGSRLLNNTFYYYTVFTKPENTNVAQAEFATVDSKVSTQSFALSTDSKKMEDLLYSLWPSLYKELDSTGDLQDLMKVFGFQLNQLYALVETYNLQDADKVLVTALLPLSEQFGLPSVGFSIGSDTLRRIARDMLPCWKLKGSKEGIANFIRIITTWDITNGTADFSEAIQDFLPNVEALRFFDPNLGNLNTRLTSTNIQSFEDNLGNTTLVSQNFIPGGRFAKSLPGIVIPGFFTFREFVIDIPNVALYVGVTAAFSLNNGTTVITDPLNNFGPDDSLVGNYILPNTEEINDIYEIIANTATTITVRGVVSNRQIGGDYAVLSPLNTNRFIILNKLLPSYIPFGTRAGFRFVIV
jgi:hypothetical protein